MRIEDQFVVRAPMELVWRYLLDVERVVPCAPGAELTEVVDERTWKGKTNVKVGPVSLSFAGTVVMEERDDAAHRAVMKAQGQEQRGKGAATATIVSRLEPAEEGTKVTIETDLTVTGAVAQYGRGMIADISKRLTKEFAGCLEANILSEHAASAAPAEASAAPAEAAPAPVDAAPAHAATAPVEPAPQDAATTPAPSPAPGGGSPGPVRSAAAPARQPAAPKPLKGFRLFLWALWRAVVRLFRRLLGGGER